MRLHPQQAGLEARPPREECFRGREAARAAGQRLEVLSIWSRDCHHVNSLEGAQDRLDAAQLGRCGARATAANVMSAALELIRTPREIPPAPEGAGTGWEEAFWRILIIEKRTRGLELLHTLSPVDTMRHFPMRMMLVGDEAEDVRASALTTLAKLVPTLRQLEVEDVIALSLPRLQDSEAVVRRAALLPIGNLDPAVRHKYLDAIRPLLKDEEESVREAAVSALEHGDWGRAVAE